VNQWLRGAGFHRSCLHLGIVVAALVGGLGVSARQAPSAVDPLHRPLDELLDLYVRDGFVYYTAVRADRGKLDRYIASLNGAAAIEHARGSRDQQKALWINAYNAFVLRTVIDHWPIKGRVAEYPPVSIRQIPGAFDKASHRVAGKAISLDGIEKDMLTPLGDARAILALGRGAYGGPRLRSEAYDAAKLDAQLDAVASEALQRDEVARIDIANNVVSVSPIFSWREAAFTSALADKAHSMFRQRSPIERAILALLEPHLVGAEKDFLEKNTFRIQFHSFDWRLNDLSSRTQ
jgi:hypothetical protein